MQTDRCVSCCKVSFVVKRPLLQNVRLKSKNSLQSVHDLTTYLYSDHYNLNAVATSLLTWCFSHVQVYGCLV
jgi:hypothetical protein